MLPDVVAVYLRDHERNVGFHSEDGGVIDYDGARVPGDGRKLPGDFATRAEKREIDPFERSGGKFSGRHVGATEANGRSRRTLRAQGP